MPEENRPFYAFSYAAVRQRGDDRTETIGTRCIGIPIDCGTYA